MGEKDLCDYMQICDRSTDEEVKRMVKKSATIHLCEGHTSFTVLFLNGIDVGISSQVQSQSILHGCAHDWPAHALHNVS